MKGSIALLVVLGVALWRAKVAPVWAPAVIFAGLVVLIVSTNPQVSAVGWALLFPAFGYLGFKVLRMSDDDWERGVESERAPSRPEAGDRAPAT